LSYVVGYSHGEIATELKVPVGTVKAWIRRSVVALQECMS
jgi:RNA polymerase sigma-70 factor (ECF subfamily)